MTDISAEVSWAAQSCIHCTSCQQWRPRTYYHDTSDKTKLAICVICQPTGKEINELIKIKPRKEHLDRMMLKQYYIHAYAVLSARLQEHHNAVRAGSDPVLVPNEVGIVEYAVIFFKSLINKIQTFEHG